MGLVSTSLDFVTFVVFPLMFVVGPRFATYDWQAATTKMKAAAMQMVDDRVGKAPQPGRLPLLLCRSLRNLIRGIS